MELSVGKIRAILSGSVLQWFLRRACRVDAASGTGPLPLKHANSHCPTWQLLEKIASKWSPLRLKAHLCRWIVVRDYLIVVPHRFVRFPPRYVTLHPEGHKSCCGRMLMSFCRVHYTETDVLTLALNQADYKAQIWLGFTDGRTAQIKWSLFSITVFFTCYKDNACSRWRTNDSESPVCFLALYVLQWNTLKFVILRLAKRLYLVLVPLSVCCLFNWGLLNITLPNMNPFLFP